MHVRFLFVAACAATMSLAGCASLPADRGYAEAAGLVQTRIDAMPALGDGWFELRLERARAGQRYAYRIDGGLVRNLHIPTIATPTPAAAGSRRSGDAPLGEQTRHPRRAGQLRRHSVRCTLAVQRQRGSCASVRGQR